MTPEHSRIKLPRLLSQGFKPHILWTVAMQGVDKRKSGHYTYVDVGVEGCQAMYPLRAHNKVQVLEWLAAVQRASLPVDCAVAARLPNMQEREVQKMVGLPAHQPHSGNKRLRVFCSLMWWHGVACTVVNYTQLIATLERFCMGRHKVCERDPAYLAWHGRAVQLTWFSEVSLAKICTLGTGMDDSYSVRSLTCLSHVGLPLTASQGIQCMLKGEVSIMSAHGGKMCLQVTLSVSAGVVATMMACSCRASRTCFAPMAVTPKPRSLTLVSTHTCTAKRFNCFLRFLATLCTDVHPAPTTSSNWF
jgi:hypothetical protein